jgi:hypothetical protein
MRLKLISCQVFCREIAAVTRRTPNRVDIEFVAKGFGADIMSRIEFGLLGGESILTSAIRDQVGRLIEDPCFEENYVEERQFTS